MKKTVLVIEDNDDERSVLRDILALSDLNVIAVGRPENICDIARSVDPDLCIIDVMLPSISGIELAAELRECGFGETPMIAISASDLMVEYALESGLFQQALVKPLELDELVSAVDLML